MSTFRVEDLAEPLTFPVEAYLSREYAKAENDRLWAKAWQHAGRVEEIPKVGSFITYNVGVESVIVIRTAADKIKAYHNVCSHRGRQLIDTPPEEHSACGTRTSRNFSALRQAYSAPPISPRPKISPAMICTPGVKMRAKKPASIA